MPKQTEQQATTHPKTESDGRAVAKEGLRHAQCGFNIFVSIVASMKPDNSEATAPKAAGARSDSA